MRKEIVWQVDAYIFEVKKRFFLFNSPRKLIAGDIYNFPTQEEAENFIKLFNDRVRPVYADKYEIDIDESPTPQIIKIAPDRSLSAVKKILLALKQKEREQL